MLAELDEPSINELEQMSVSPYENRFAIARAMTDIDSRILPSDLRQSLGLPPNPPNLETNIGILPTLFKPNRDNWNLGLCLNSEYNLNEAFGKLGDQQWAPLYLLGCLIGKKNELVAGVCFENTEFPNGTVFIKGVWYRPRSYYQQNDLVEVGLADRLRSLTLEDSEDIEEKELKIDLHVRYPETVATKDLIVAKNIGGCWEPARSFSGNGGFFYSWLYDDFL